VETIVREVALSVESRKEERSVDIPVGGLLHDLLQLGEIICQCNGILESIYSQFTAAGISLLFPM
jgi:hypothetical protein